MSILEQQFPQLFGAERQPRRAGSATPSAMPRPRTSPSVTSQQPRVPMRPVVNVEGVPTLMLPVGDLAAVIGRSVGRVRQLEKDGVLPPARHRRRVAGHRGWRLYPAGYVLEVGRIAAEERIPSRRAVQDMSRFSERVWAAHEAICATEGRETA